MNYQQMKDFYTERYDNEGLAGSDTRTLLDMIERAGTMSQAAQGEFVKAFSFEFALCGEVYLGGKRSAAHRFPHLIAEGPAAGLTLIIR